MLLSCQTKVHKTEQNITLNFDAAQGYFDLVDNLTFNKSVTDVQWNTFLKIEGNKLYLT